MNSYYSHLWTRQAQTHSFTPVINGAASRIEQRDIGSPKEDAPAQHLRSAPGTGPKERVKVPFTKTYKLKSSPNGDGPSLQEVYPSSLTVDTKSTKAKDICSSKTIWNPNAPEFIPSSTLGSATKLQTKRPNSGERAGPSKYNLQRRDVAKEISQEGIQMKIEDRPSTRSTGRDENVRSGSSASRDYNYLRTDNPGKVPSTLERFIDNGGSDNVSVKSQNSVSAQARIPKVRRVMRRELTRSEPSGIGRPLR